MLDEDAILNSPVVYSEEEVLTRFRQSREAEAEEPGRHTERLKRAAEDFCQMLERNKSPSDPFAQGPQPALRLTLVI